MTEINQINYNNIFEMRGQQHAEAFHRFPMAVEEECASVLSFAKIQPGDVVLDVPSASGFLRRHLKIPDVKLSAVDPSPILHALCKLEINDCHCSPMNKLPFSPGFFDVVICLAGLHHETDLIGVFSEVNRVLSKKGRFIIAEVDENSGPANFLNKFVNNYSSLGHQGHFFSDTYRQSLLRAGFKIMEERLARYHWKFASFDDMTTCLALMFGIDSASSAMILAAVEDSLGIDSGPNDEICMRWCLRQVMCIPSEIEW